MRTEDGYIIQKCLDGDSAAFGLLVEKYKKGIYALAFSKIGSFHDAQDITQEVFISAYQNLRTLRRWDSFMGWLYRITTNQCKMLIRARSRRPDREFVEDQERGILDQPSMDSYRENGSYESIREALDSLPEMYRQILTLRYFGGMTTVEMSRFLGVSPATIKRRLREARGQLKEGVLDMMNTTYEQHQLPASFTFRIVEMVKRIKINAMPRSTGLPWGLSLAAGIAVVVMSLGSQMAIYKQPTPLAFPSETETLKVREMSVDILSAPGTSVMAGKQGDTDGVGMDQRSPQSKFLLAPAKGGGTWTQKADMPTVRSNCAADSVDGKIYVVGGYIDNKTFDTTAALEEYDPATDTWTVIGADMPTKRGALSFHAVNGIIYAFAGWSPRRFAPEVEAYDPATKKWTKKANIPTPGDGFATAVVDGKIYVIGGHTGGNNIILSTVQIYDPATNKWTRGANMPTARWGCAACAINGKIYVTGGSLTHASGNVIATVEVYDPATDTWSRVSDMPCRKGGHDACALDGKMYIICGYDNDAIDLFNAGEIGEDELVELISIINVYDPTTDTWSTAASIPTPRSNAAVAVADGKIYAIGGSSGPEGAFISTVEEFDPGLPHSISGVSPDRKVPTYWGEVKSGK